MSSPVSDFSANQNLTLEQFQQFAETHEGMWELYDGVPVKMQSPAPEHQWISFAVQRQLADYFQDKNCMPLSETDVCISQKEFRHATRKPDLLVYCDKSQRKQHMIFSPQLVVEIWSPSNSMKERLEKMRTYQQAGAKEFWQIDYERQDFAVISFSSENPMSISGGSFQDDIVSEYFPGLRVSLAGYAGFLERF